MAKQIVIGKKECVPSSVDCDKSSSPTLPEEYKATPTSSTVAVEKNTGTVVKDVLPSLEISCANGYKSSGDVTSSAMVCTDKEFTDWETDAPTCVKQGATPRSYTCPHAYTHTPLTLSSTISVCLCTHDLNFDYFPSLTSA